MKLHIMDNNPSPGDYIVNDTDIIALAAKYGRANDRIELYDDDGKLVSVAVWPLGSKRYIYCHNPEGDPHYWTWHDADGKIAQ